MKRHDGSTALVFLAMSFLLAAPTWAKVIHVNVEAALGGDGMSWSSAFRYLQDGLAQAGGGDEVWVAAGTYFPDEGAGVTDGDRTATFELIEGVTVLGGFSGSEMSVLEREPIRNATILSGEIWEDELYWSLHVVTVLGSTVIDALSITKGNANGDVAPFNNGGAIIISGNSVSLELTKCVIFANSAVGSGGAIHSSYSSTTLSATECEFSGNSANSYGGAIYTYTSSAFTAVGCEFSGNSAGFRGGSIYSYYSSPVTSIDCMFLGNSAGFYGGAIYVDSSSPAIVTDCSFLGNSANSDGGAIYSSFSQVNAINSDFSSNSARYEGGAICSSSTPVVTATGCSFSNNSASRGGAIRASTANIDACGISGNTGAAVYVTRITATGCDFLDNSASPDGGAIRASSQADATRCVFSGNSASDRGGAIYASNSNSTITVSNCVFSENFAKARGGSIYSLSTSTIGVTSSKFFSNSAGERGGAIYASDAIIAVAGCVFSLNESVIAGGGIYVGAVGSSLTAVNCTFFDNRLPGGMSSGRAIAAMGLVKLFNNVIWEPEASSGLVFIDSTATVRNADSLFPSPSNLSKNLVKGGFSSFAIVSGATVSLGDTAATIPSDDPMFLNPENPTGADGLWGTSDDGLRVRTGSGAIDEGLSSYLPLDDQDLDNDGNTTEQLPVDAAGYLREQGAGLDLGAYEAGPGFADWAAGHGLTGDHLAWSACPAKDGVTNLIKFALGLDPWVSSPPHTDGSSPGLPALIWNSDGALRFVAVVDTSSADLSFEVEESGTLTSWQRRTSGVSQTPLEGGVVRLEILIPGESSRQFRLKVESE